MVDQERRAFVSAPDGGDALDTPARGTLAFLAKGERTSGALTAFVSNIAPGEGPPFHLHLNEDEMIYVLEGRLRVRLEEAIHEAPVGSLVFLPRRVPHAWQNVGDEPARFLGVFTPAAPSMERFFERAAELPEGSRLADAFGTLAGAAGMDVLGPPLAQSHPAPSARG